MIALYLRVSRASDAEGESNSVLSQRLVLQKYSQELIEQGKLEPDEITEFVDDGYTGMSVMRPALQEMLSLCYVGLIQVVMVVELSRLARDYVDLGTLLEHTFPVLGVRFLSLTERYDSNESMTNHDADFLRGIISVANCYYSRDISVRVRASVVAHWRQGVHVHAFAPFGYLYNPDTPSHLSPDPIAKNYVIRVFELAACGMSLTGIARQLNDENIPTPAMYARTEKIYGKGSCYSGKETPWNARKVRYLLRREVYCGVHVGGLTRQLGVGKGSAKRETVPFEQTRVENAHEPLITHELYTKAQRVFRRR